jgi:hypothetical protein
MSATETKINPLETAALDAAARGLRVFPIRAGAKIPRIKGWRKAATTDAAQIREWWAKWPNCNVGICTDDLFVIDIDPRKQGEQSFKKLCEQHADDGKPMPTALVKTWSGGWHFYYLPPLGMAIANSVEHLGPGVDVRASGGLVVGPGSVIKGKPYSWANELKITTAPMWLAKAAGTAQPKAETVHRLVDEDEESIESAYEYLATQAPDFVPHGKRDDTAYTVAAALYDYAVSRDTCRDLLAEWNRCCCEPPLATEDIERIATSAEISRQTAPGSKHSKLGNLGFDYDPADCARIIQLPGTERVEQPEGEQPKSKGYAFTLAKDIRFEPKRFLIEDFVEWRECSAWYGEPDSGKSTGVLHAGACVSSGTKFCGKRILEAGAVLYVAAERGGVTKRRIKAWCIKHGKPDIPLAIIDDAVNLRTNKIDADRIIEAARELARATDQRVVWIIFDTLNRVLAGGDENSPVDMGSMVAAFTHVHRQTGAHCTLVHHTPLEKIRLRGHGSLLGALDQTVLVRKTGEHSLEIIADKGNDLVDKPKFAMKFESVHLFTDPDTRVRTTAPVLIPAEPWDLDLTPEQEGVLRAVGNITNFERPFSVVEVTSALHGEEAGKNEKQAIRHMLDNALKHAQWVERDKPVKGVIHYRIRATRVEAARRLFID